LDGLQTITDITIRRDAMHMLQTGNRTIHNPILNRPICLGLIRQTRRRYIKASPRDSHTRLGGSFSACPHFARSKYLLYFFAFLVRTGKKCSRQITHVIPAGLPFAGDLCPPSSLKRSFNTLPWGRQTQVFALDEKADANCYSFLFSCHFNVERSETHNLRRKTQS